MALKELKSIVPFFKPLFSACRKYLVYTGWGITVNEYTAFSLIAALIVSLVFYALVYTVILALTQNIFISLVFGFGGSLWGFLIGILIMMYLPRYTYISLGKRIDVELPYVTAHFSTIAGVGIPIPTVLKIMSSFEEYKVLSKRFYEMYKNISIMGTDLFSALEYEAKLTPSKKWGEILYGVLSILKTGGNIKMFLEEEAEKLLEEKRMLERKFIETLNLITEVYMVVFVVTPIMIIIAVAIMGMIGMSGDINLKAILWAFVYIGMPFIAFMFVLIINLLRPAEI